MQQLQNPTFNGVTLAILFGDKVAVSCRRGAGDGVIWGLPQAVRATGESPADCALRLLKETISLDLPVTRLNWPIVGEDGSEAGQWFFAAWITQAEWDMFSPERSENGPVILGVSAFLSADTVPEPQKAMLHRYLYQSQAAMGHV
ncbi:hypothetical protein [Tropicimonas sp. S265A]|uniref:hypothetical protein n=1 Tax=Tropicimonas sp. S265A TaxID=3415134 RepID=UPI003C7A352E